MCVDETQAVMKLLHRAVLLYPNSATAKPFMLCLSWLVAPLAISLQALHFLSWFMACTFSYHNLQTQLKASLLVPSFLIYTYIIFSNQVSATLRPVSTKRVVH